MFRSTFIVKSALVMGGGLAPVPPRSAYPRGGGMSQWFQVQRLSRARRAYPRQRQSRTPRCWVA